MKKLLSVFVLLFGFIQAYGITTPSTPTGLNSPDATNGSLTLRWKSALDADGYNVYYIPIIGDYILVKKVVGVSNTTTEITKIGISEKLLPATSYSFTVRAYNGAGNSRYSEPTEAKTTHTWAGELLNCLVAGHPGVSTPPTRTELAGIISFTCGNKNLTTMAPTEDLSDITYLNLYNNDIVGEIPSWITDRTGLDFLHLGDNNLTGEIPSGIDKLINLQILSLYENDLTGSIPVEIGNLSNLRELNIGYNNLTGEIPSEIGNDTNLTNLSLYINNLTGEIPSEIGKLTKLTILSLISNKLSGRIPVEIDKLENLERLFLYDNDLTGEIPMGIENLNFLKYLYLYNNCNLYTNEPSLQAFIDSIATSSSTEYQYILDTNSHDCNTFNPSVMMYLLD